MGKNLTCVVTIHGIGFEQPPQNNVVNSGYADLLYQSRLIFMHFPLLILFMEIIFRGNGSERIQLPSLSPRR